MRFDQKGKLKRSLGLTDQLFQIEHSIDVLWSTSEVGWGDGLETSWWKCRFPRRGASERGGNGSALPIFRCTCCCACR